MKKLASGFFLLLAMGFITWPIVTRGRNIDRLLKENDDLKAAIQNLTSESPIAYAKVIGQKEINGDILTSIRFVEVDPKVPEKKILERTFDLKGEEIYFDLLVIKFDDSLIKDGSKKALHLWRRVFSEKESPENGIVIEKYGSHPSRYEDINQTLSLNEANQFWQSMWELSHHPKALNHLGIRAIEGKATYRKMKSGWVYAFHLKNTGEVTTAIIPDL